MSTHIIAEHKTFPSPLQILDSHNENLITSAFSFGYERRDCPIIQNFVKTHNLHECIQTKQNDLDRFIALNHYVAQLPNTRHNMWQDIYPWTLDQILVDENGHTAVKGHCMSYASVLISALTGLGYYARHWAVEGVRFMNHEVVEVWSDELHKWVYLDPSLDQHYIHPETHEPMSLLDMHRIVINTFFHDGETLLMPMEEQKKRVQSIGGRNAPIACIDLGYHYGSYTEDYDWGWFHGYLAAGFMQLTTRNDFHSHPDPVFPYFGDGIDEDHGFPHWIDEKTPPKTDRVKLFSDRERDFYWTLNQAAFHATRISDNALDLEFSQTQPFFDHYVVTIDGSSHTQTEDRLTWTLHPGENTLSVAPENEWGDRGTESYLTIEK